MKVKSTAPHFFVSDINKSVRFYVDVLGFDEPKIWGNPPCFAMPSHDGFSQMAVGIVGMPTFGVIQ